MKKLGIIFATVALIFTAGCEAQARCNEDCWIRKSYESTGRYDAYDEYQASKYRTERSLRDIEHEREMEKIRRKYEDTKTVCVTDRYGKIDCY